MYYYPPLFRSCAARSSLHFLCFFNDSRESFGREWGGVFMLAIVALGHPVAACNLAASLLVCTLSSLRLFLIA